MNKAQKHYIKAYTGKGAPEYNLLQKSRIKEKQDRKRDRNNAILNIALAIVSVALVVYVLFNVAFPS